MNLDELKEKMKLTDAALESLLPPENRYPEIIYKCLGVCYITQLGSGCCRDCGESGLASVVEAAGRIAILAVSLPLFKALVNIIEKILT